MQYLSVLLPVAALASGALANPGYGAGSDSCAAEVTGSAALGDAGLRASDCKSYLATTVSLVATEVVYITDSGSEWSDWEDPKKTYAVCPNGVPDYASDCDDAHYTSACSVFGYTDVITTTVAPTTTTKTIIIVPSGGAGETVTKAGSTTTVTVGGATTVTSTSTTTKTVGGATTVTSTTTKTVGGATTVTSTVTETETKEGSSTWSATTTTVTETETDTGTCTSTASPTKCNVDDALATKLVENFEILLEFTNGPGGRGYNQEVSDETLAEDFVDISDSINFMSGVPLGAISFNSKADFDAGQGSQPEVALDALNIWHDCESVTWRWRISSLPLPVTGISHFTVNDDKLIQKNWVEFDNGAWLQSYGQNCSFGSQAGAPGPTVVSPQSKRNAVLNF